MTFKPQNAATWFSIPARDFDSSVRFYEQLLNISLDRVIMDGDASSYARFPVTEGGVSGAVTSDERYKKGGTGAGVVVYLACKDIDAALAKVEELGGKLLAPKMDLPADMGQVAVVADCDGNPVGLHQA
ncbi:VOC family protein [uncultured Cohaesibacter sp.]|uniref:VOC family protein n=1 Tax=uncultured Cohaesibacter sp. TaxID=1002546 RepID=UPI0029C94C3C|nr:VOC family protein [uncultured Cohaesibacter sp.]